MLKAAETWSESPLKTFLKASRNRRALAAPHEVERKKDFAKPCLLNDTNSICHGFFGFYWFLLVFLVFFFWFFERKNKNQWFFEP